MKSATKYGIIAAVVIVIIVVAAFEVPPLLFPSSPKTLVVGSYGGAYDQAFEAVAKNFTAQTGIPVQVVNVGGSLGELPKVLAGTSGIDVWATGEIPVVAAAKAGLLVPLNGQPNIDALPASVKETINGSAYAVFYDTSALGVVYNANSMKTPPTTWNEYISMIENGSISGTVGIIPPSHYQAAIIIQMALVAGGNEKNVTGGWQLIKQIAPHMGYVFAGPSSAISAMSSGDLVALIPGDVTIGYAASQAGAHVQFKILQGAPPLLSPDPLAVLKGPNQKEALQFVNFCMLAQEDAILARVDGDFPTNPQSAVSQSSLSYLGMSLSQLYNQAYSPDWVYVSNQYSSWSTQWTNEVVPLIPTK